MEKRVWISLLTLIIVVGFISAVAILFSRGGMTGFATYEEGSQSDFDEGTYLNTEYNGTDVVLLSGQVSGTYTSKVFDATNDATWNSLAHGSSTPSINYIYGVDGGGDVYASTDLGVTWGLKQEDFGRTTTTTEMFSNSNYLYILSSAGNEVWRSENGTGFSIIYSGFDGKSPYVGDVDSSGNLYVATGPGEVWKSVDSGVSWNLQGDFNGASTNDPKGLAIYNNGYISAVGSAGNVFKSTDSGVTWEKVNDGYGGSTGTDGMVADSSNNLYILLNKKTYKSSDSGVTWTVINDSFTSYANDGCRMLIDDSDNFFIVDCIGRTFKSTDSGISWTELGDMNAGASNNPKGITEFIQATNLSFQIRNCSQSDCSDGTWQTLDLSSLNLVGRYFQYKVDFTSPDISITPSLASIIIDYDLINTAPTIILASPQDGDSYGTNESLALNFMASDADDNIDSCWYKIDSGENIIITGCANTSFDVAEGDHTLTVYINDTEGEEASDSATFSVSVGAPTIVLSFPINSYLGSQDVTFRYTPTDTDLDSCELWGDFNSTFSLNQTDTSPSSGQENTFSLGLNDGTYLWNIVCNDSLGNKATNGNKTFYIDTINPRLSLTEPSGAKTSRTDIPLTFSVSDNSPLYCWYNVQWATGGSVISNTSIANCSNTDFDVAANGNYLFYLYVNDSAGNSNSTNSSFSVDTSSAPPAPPSGGGGGGGGGSVVVKPKFSMSFSSLEDVVMSPGESKSLSLEVRNTGRLMQNNCKIKDVSWIQGSDEKDLNANEQFDFVFKIEVPKDAETGDYDLLVILNCQDGEKNQSLRVSVIGGDIAISIKEIQDIKRNQIIFAYILKESGGKEVDVDLSFLIVDVDGNTIAESSDSVSLSALEEKESIAEIDLPDGTSGEYELIIEAESGGISVKDRTSVLITGQGVTGFAGFLNMSEANRKYFSIALLIGAAGLIGFFIVKRIMKSMGESSSKKEKTS